MNSNSAHVTIPALEMRGVAVASLREPQDLVCEGVDWTVQPGEFWAVAGMHGSGKGDLLALAAGLTAPVAGEYRLFGCPMPIIGEDSPGDRLRVGLVFDGGRMMQHLTVRENIALPLLYHRQVDEAEAGRRVAAMIERTGLTAVADTTPGNLSRALQKQTGLARALMIEPEVLLLDDPLGGLDLRQSRWWLDMLEDWKGRSGATGRPLTLVVTTGDLRPWRSRAGHFALLRDRRFIPLGGRPGLATHSEPLVKELLAEQ